jgi:hypothetical protein
MKTTLTRALVTLMSNGKPWTFWGLQEAINNRFDEFYGEPTISAGIRELRRVGNRRKYGLPMTGEVISKERIPYSNPVSGKYLARGYQYRLITNNEETS